MNRYVAQNGVLLLLGVVIAILGGQASHSQAGGAHENTFVQLQRKWAEARKNGNMTFLENFYAKEFTVGNMNGAESSRAEDLAMFSSGDLKPAIITDREMKVNIFGEAAMVTGVEHVEGTYRGHPGLFDLRFTNVFVYRDHRWQLVRHQSTPIGQR